MLTTDISGSRFVYTVFVFIVVKFPSSNAKHQFIASCPGAQMLFDSYHPLPRTTPFNVGTTIWLLHSTVFSINWYLLFSSIEPLVNHIFIRNVSWLNYSLVSFTLSISQLMDLYFWIDSLTLEACKMSIGPFFPENRANMFDARSVIITNSMQSACHFQWKDKANNTVECASTKNEK